AAVGQFDRRQAGEWPQSDGVDQLERAIVEHAQHAFRSPELEGVAQPALQSDTDILAHRKMREDGRDLERAREPHARNGRGRAAGDVAALETDAAGRRRQEMREQVEAGSLAGAVGTDQRMNRVTPDPEIDVFDRDEAPEFLRQPFRLEDYFFAGHTPPCGRLKRSRAGLSSRTGSCAASSL